MFANVIYKLHFKQCQSQHIISKVIKRDIINSCFYLVSFIFGNGFIMTIFATPLDLHLISIIDIDVFLIIENQITAKLQCCIFGHFLDEIDETIISWYF